MSLIRSPLGALGALLVSMQAISVGALVAVNSQPYLQIAIVVVMLLVVFAVAATVCFLVVLFALQRPGLLFNPQDIAQSVHRDLYLPISPGRVVEAKLLDKES